MAGAQEAENHGDEAWPDIFYERYTNQFQPEPTHKIHKQQQKHWALRYPPMEHLSNDQEDHSNQHENSHKLCNETDIPLWIWSRINGNWDNNTIRISQWRESHCRTITSVRRKKKVQKSSTTRITVWDQRRKVNYWVRSFEVEKLSQSSPGGSVPPE